MPHPGPVFQVEFGTVDGRLMLATACRDSNLRLWDPIRPSGARASVSERVESVTLAATATGRLLAGVGSDGRISVWDADTGASRQNFEIPAHTAGTPVALGEHMGRAVVAAAGAGVARAWDVERGDLIYELALPGTASATAVTRSDVVVVLPAGEDALDVWSLVEVAPRFRYSGSNWLWPFFLDHAERGPVLAVMDLDSVALLEPGHGEPVWPALHARIGVDAALGRIDGDDVLAIRDSYAITLWDLASGERRGPGVRSTGHTNGVAMARVGDRDLIFSGHFATVRVWNALTGRLVAELPFGTTISALAVHPTPDGAALVAVSGPGVAVAEFRNEVF
jgi:WD40 repeat protein